MQVLRLRNPSILHVAELFEHALYKHLKKTSVLPNPDGPLSARLPSSAIAKANEEVDPLLTENTYCTSKKGGKGWQVGNRENRSTKSKSSHFSVIHKI